MLSMGKSTINGPFSIAMFVYQSVDIPIPKREIAGLVSTNSIGLYNIICVYIYIWLVVSTLLKNMSQLGLLFPICGKIKHVPNHQPDIYIYIHIHIFTGHVLICQAANIPKDRRRLEDGGRILRGLAFLRSRHRLIYGFV